MPNFVLNTNSKIREVKELRRRILAVQDKLDQTVIDSSIALMAQATPGMCCMQQIEDTLSTKLIYFD